MNKTEKLVRVNNRVLWRVLLFILVLWAIFLGCNYVFEDPLLFVVLGIPAVASLGNLWVVSIISPSKIEKDEEGYYKFKLFFIDHYVSQDDLSYEEDDSAVYISLAKLGHCKMRFFFDEEKFQTHELSIARVLLQIIGMATCDIYSYLIGRDYMYVGDGDPYDFFRDTRPPERKKPLEPPPVEVPPEKGNPYGTELPDE